MSLTVFNTIPSSVEEIGDLVFSNTLLQSFAFRSNCTLKTIPAKAFNNCHLLQSIELPPSLEAIENCAFYNCTSLFSVSFSSEGSSTPTGSSLKTICPFAFKGCRKLRQFDFPPSIIIEREAFDQTGVTLPITMPNNRQVSLFQTKGIVLPI